MSFSISFSAAQTADQLHGEVVGDGSVELIGFASAEAQRSAISPSPKNQHILLLLNKARPLPFS